MSRLLNSSALFLLCVIILPSCGFIDLRPIGLTVKPDGMDELLDEKLSPVILKFDTEMIKNETEDLLQISCDTGMVKGDKRWEGNSLYFTPVGGWSAGTRYSLSLSGTLRAADGRELRIERFISFYAINKCAPPLLECFSPADGASIMTDKAVLELKFSCPMDRLTSETALTVDGFGTKEFEWSHDDRVLKVTAAKGLSPWTSYRWNLKNSAQSRDGAALPVSYSAQFATDLDQTLPSVKKIFPVLNSGGVWLATGADIETGLGPGQGIAVEFNKKMDENVLRSVRFEPSLNGRTEFLADNAVIFILNRDPEPDTAYALIVSGDSADTQGLKLGKDHVIYFIPDIPFLEIIYLNAGNGAVIEDFSGSNKSIQVFPDPAAYTLSVYFRFSLPITEEEKKNIPFKISLNAFFPGNLAVTSLQDVLWISGDILQMRWEGLNAGSIDEPHFYKLTIPGDKNGIVNGSGMYMKNDVTVYLEAVK